MYFISHTTDRYSLLQLFLSPGKLCTCISLKYNSASVPSVKCLLLNVLMEWLCTGKPKACCMWLNSFHAVKKYRNKVPWQSAAEIAFVPYRWWGKQLSKRITSAEEKCNYQNSNMVTRNINQNLWKYLPTLLQVIPVRFGNHTVLDCGQTQLILNLKRKKAAQHMIHNFFSCWHLALQGYHSFLMSAQIRKLQFYLLHQWRKALGIQAILGLWAIPLNQSINWFVWYQ